MVTDEVTDVVTDVVTDAVTDAVTDVVTRLRERDDVRVIEVGSWLVQSKQAAVDAEGLGERQPDDQRGQHLPEMYMAMYTELYTELQGERRGDAIASTPSVRPSICRACRVRCRPCASPPGRTACAGRRKCILHLQS